MQPAPTSEYSTCATCAAVANELERQVNPIRCTNLHTHPSNSRAEMSFSVLRPLQMRDEWSHLQLTVRDRKRKLAAEAVQQEACNDAVKVMLDGICDAVREYAYGVGRTGQQYYQKLTNKGSPRDKNIVITGHLNIGGNEATRRLHVHCLELMASHEDRLFKLMADGTDDLIKDLCIDGTADCTADEVARLPPQALPRREDTK